MKLSMWILADWLKKYNPIVNIESGERVLRGTRILSNDIHIEPQYVYLAPAEGFISGRGSQIICVHGHDMLLLDTTDMDEAFNDVLEAFDYYNKWSDGIEKCISEGCDLQYLLDQSYEVFREPMVVFDAGHVTIAHTTQYGPDDVDNEWGIIIRTGSNSLNILNKLKDHLYQSRYSHSVQEMNFPFFSTRSMQKMLFHDRTVIGRIILLEFHRREGKGTMHLMDELGSLMELWMRQSQAGQLLRSECAIFQDMLDGVPVSDKELNHKLSLVGWEKRQEKYLLKIEIPAAYKDTTDPLLTKLERQLPDCYVFFHQECIFILANLAYTSWDILEQTLNKFLCESVFHCAVSYPFSDILQLTTAAEQCRITLQVALQKQGGIYQCRDHALDYIRDIIHTQIDSSVIHPALYILKKNDEKNQNDLYKTLRVYLRNNCNLAHTAKALNLHRNSLLYRLNKIQMLTELDFDDERIREYLRLSFIVLGD